LGEAELARTREITTDALGEFPYVVEASWDASEDSQGRVIYTIQLKDHESTAKGNLEANELPWKPFIRFRLHRLVDDLLRDRYNRIMGNDSKNGS
jgi:hypothetical protein